MSMKLATAYVDITARDAGFKQGINDMRSEIESNVRGLASLLGQIGIGAGIGVMVKGALSIAEQAESSAVAFNVMLKDMDRTKQLLADLNRFSVVTPFEPAEVRRAGQALLAFRNEADEIPALLQVLGDAASGTGANLNEVVAIFNKVKSVGKLTGETFEQFAQRGINLQAELTSMLGVTGDEFVKMRSKGEISFDKVLQALQKMTQEGGMFYGAMIKQSTTAAGLWSTLQGNIKDLAATFGAVLLPAWKSVLTVSINTLNALSALNTATGGFIAQTTAATVAITALSLSVMALRTGLTALGITWKKVLIGSGIGVVVVALGAVLTLVYRLGAAIASTSPVVEAAQAAVAKFQLAWERISGAVMTAVDAVRNAVWGLMTTIAETFGIELGKIEQTTGGFVAQLIGKVADFVLSVAEWAQVLVQNWDTTWEAIKQGAVVALLFMRDTFTNLPALMGYALGRGLRLFVDFFQTLMKLAWKAITTIGRLLADVFTRIWEGIKNLFAGKSFGDVFEAGVNTIVQQAQKAAEGFAAGWNKEGVDSIFEPSDALKAAMDKQGELLGKLQAAKRELEAESAARLGATPETAPTPTATPKAGPPQKVTAEIKWESGFSAFDQMSKSIQEQLLKGDTKDDKLVKQGEIAAHQRDEQTRLLKEIAEASTTEPVAAD